jgi:hypothetical protein
MSADRDEEHLMSNPLSRTLQRRRAPGAVGAGGVPAAWDTQPAQEDRPVDLNRRYELLSARVAELQWDLGGLVYEMAARDAIRADILVQRAAILQEADAELAEVERILLTEQTGAAGACSNCGAPHSSGAVYCWQCGSSLLSQVVVGAV